MSDKNSKSKRQSPMPLPDGLKELVELMTWSVTKEKPENVCQFLIDCNRELLQFKDGRLFRELFIFSYSQQNVLFSNYLPVLHD